MTRWFLFTLTALFIVAYTVVIEQTPIYQGAGTFSSLLSASLLTPSSDSPKEKIVMGIVRYVEPAKGIIILETHTDVLIVRVPADVCQRFQKGDIIMATLAPNEKKIPV